MVDLANRLPMDARRLRLTTAFEIYWDAARLCERVANDQNKQCRLSPDHTDLHRRGFSEFMALPATGHAMMGVSLGPITGRLVAEILSADKPSLNLGLLNPDRFN
ncbi:MAG: Tetratricopeptide 2 repeat protein [Pedosphaera sp.]|nr:Tetratricopeptide 2 repeat protein [Pedosphaera sp.]